MTDTAALDDVLNRFATTGPEYGSGLSNHGPMAAEALAGKIWSARFEGVKPRPTPAIAEIVIGPATPEDVTGIQSLLGQAGLPADIAGQPEDFLVARHHGSIVGCVGMEVAGRDALFRSLAVEPAYRGGGLGRRGGDLPRQASQPQDRRDLWHRGRALRGITYQGQLCRREIPDGEDTRQATQADVDQRR